MPDKDSPHMEEAKELLNNVRKESFDSDKRKKEALNLAQHLLSESLRIQSKTEKSRQAELFRMMHDARGKTFSTAFTDRAFRTSNPVRATEQICHLLDLYGLPRFLSPIKKLKLCAFRLLGQTFPSLTVKMAMRSLRQMTSHVIIPGEHEKFVRHLEKRRQQNFRLNINHLGEAILGEQEAQRRLNIYLNDLMKDSVECVSVKISTLYSQINPLAWDDTLDKLAERLRELYRAAMTTYPAKLVTLDMEEFRDTHLTVDLFKKVLSEPEFLPLTAGIALQAYLPESFDHLQHLTAWAEERMQNGGAPIRIRIVKGANIAMEDVEASIKGWPRAPYQNKVETDGNFKMMLDFAMHPERMSSVRIGVGSHNLFDIAYALILRTERGVETAVEFEMLEGMCDHYRDVIQSLCGNVLLYTPVATAKDFQHALAYLFRRLDENTGPDNFLRYSFGLEPGSDEWDMQVTMFLESCKELNQLDHSCRRTQDRNKPVQITSATPFENEPDTDFSLPQNAKWAKGIVEEWQHKTIDPIPLVIGSQTIHHNPPSAQGWDKSQPLQSCYSYSSATSAELDKALIVAKGHEQHWANVPVTTRCACIKKLANILRKKRGALIGAIIKDGGKSFAEADSEVSEAIDFAEYYVDVMQRMHLCTDLELSPKGTYLVASPWNFPIAIPAGSIIGALLAGNCILFKPASETVLCGHLLVRCFWEAGIDQNVLQFIPTADDPEGSNLIRDARLTGVILTGSTETAQHFISLRPNLEISAETGGKNSMIITALADRDQAVRDLLHSAFGHNGQKCSATSLAICEHEVYHDSTFRRQLRDAAASLHVGSAWDMSSKITPLIKQPSEKLLRGLTRLEPGEEWLLEPRQDTRNPKLWSPGIKLGVKKGGFTHQTELFGPVLGIMCANNLDHAIKLANGTPYGLTSGLHSLDEREQHKWQQSIRAGNLYINRTTTGAIVRRQPFGGTKQSSFGFGVKAGGSNYLMQFMHIKHADLPKEKYPVGELVNNLTPLLEKFDFTTEEQGLWYGSLSNYAYWYQRLGNDKDRIKLIGQDNILRYIPRKKIALRIFPGDKPIDILRVIAATLTCKAPLQVSWDPKEIDFRAHANWELLLPHFSLHRETLDELKKRIKNHDIRRLRLLSPPDPSLITVCRSANCTPSIGPVLANGRYELLHYLRELSISFDYHRYGNLGIRDGELRKPTL
ncbi:MAG: proline dehydrogenase family protein [Chlamydiia bacterium]|nr:proline dehydrogenase family protein [Chlamydiia bacterium]